MSSEKRPNRLDIATLIFTLAYITGFAIWFFGRGNYEFIWYIITMLALIALVGATLNRSKRGSNGGFSPSSTTGIPSSSAVSSTAATSSR